jgi:hypothetical protein
MNSYVDIIHNSVCFGQKCDKCGIPMACARCICCLRALCFMCFEIHQKELKLKFRQEKIT